MRMLFSRTSNRTVVKRKTATSRRKGRSRASDRRCAPAAQSAAAHQIDVIHQAVGTRVARVLGGRLFALGILDGDVDARQHAGEELAENLPAVTRGARLAVGSRLDRLHHGLAERVRQLERVLLDAEIAHQVQEPSPVAAQAGEARLPQGAPRDFAGDIGIAVAISADPGSELQEQRDIHALAGELMRERALDFGEYLRHHIEEVLVEKIKTPGHLLLDGWFGQLELAGEPQEFDLIAHGTDQLLPLAIRPARRFEIKQSQVDASVPLEHGDALGLGRMGGDHRPHAQPRERLADLGGA